MCESCVDAVGTASEKHFVVPPGEQCRAGAYLGRLLRVHLASFQEDYFKLARHVPHTGLNLRQRERERGRETHRARVTREREREKEREKVCECCVENVESSRW